MGPGAETRLNILGAPRSDAAATKAGSTAPSCAALNIGAGRRHADDQRLRLPGRQRHLRRDGRGAAALRTSGPRGLPARRRQSEAAGRLRGLRFCFHHIKGTGGPPTKCRHPLRKRRHGLADHRHTAYRPGPRDDVPPDPGPSPGRGQRAHPTPPGRHRPGARTAVAMAARARPTWVARRSGAPRTRSSPRAWPSPPTPWKRRRPTCASRRAASSCPAPTAPSASSRWRGARSRQGGEPIDTCDYWKREHLTLSQRHPRRGSRGTTATAGTSKAGCATAKSTHAAAGQAADDRSPARCMAAWRKARARRAAGACGLRCGLQARWWRARSWTTPCRALTTCHRSTWAFNGTPCTTNPLGAKGLRRGRRHRGLPGDRQRHRRCADAARRDGFRRAGDPARIWQAMQAAQRSAMLRRRCATASPSSTCCSSTLPAEGLVLEVASGSGRACRAFRRQPAAAGVPAQRSRPRSTREHRCLGRNQRASEHPAGDGTRRRGAGLAGRARADAVLCCNMIHIAPWAAAVGLVSGAARVLPDHGLLYLYGPFAAMAGTRRRATRPSTATSGGATLPGASAISKPWPSSRRSGLCSAGDRRNAGEQPVRHLSAVLSLWRGHRARRLVDEEVGARTH